MCRTHLFVYWVRTGDKPFLSDTCSFMARGSRETKARYLHSIKLPTLSPTRMRYLILIKEETL